MKLTQAQIAHVKFLENERGQITAALVLADARRDDSPLHGLFDWEDPRAAEKFRLDQARLVIREVQIRITTTTTSVAAPFYVRDPEAPRAGYVSVFALQRNAAAARESLLQELTRVAGNLTRAKSLALVLGFGDEMDTLMAEVLGVQQRITGALPGSDEAATDIVEA
jgi:hypothetical protein